MRQMVNRQQDSWLSLAGDCDPWRGIATPRTPRFFVRLGVRGSVDPWSGWFPSGVVGNGCGPPLPLAFGPGVRRGSAVPHTPRLQGYRSLVTAGCCQLGSAVALLFAPPFILLSTFKHYCTYLVYHAWYCTLPYINQPQCTDLYTIARKRPLMYIHFGQCTKNSITGQICSIKQI